MEAIQELLRQLEDKLKTEVNNREDKISQEWKSAIESIKEHETKNLVSNTQLWNQLQEMKSEIEKEREVKEDATLEANKAYRKDTDEKIRRIGKGCGLG